MMTGSRWKNDPEPGTPLGLKTFDWSGVNDKWASDYIEVELK
jgi:hypothetical protein